MARREVVGTSESKLRTPEMINDRASRFGGRLVTATLVGAICGAGSAEVEAADVGHRMWMQLGAFRPHIDSVFRYDSIRTAGLGTSIDGERDLGLTDNEIVGSLLLGVRLRDRWRVEFEYFELDRSAQTSTRERDLAVGDTSYALSAQLASAFASAVYRLTVGYSFIRSPRAEVGLALGLHVTDFSISLEGTGTVNGTTVARRREQQEVLLPLPTGGLYGSFAFSSSWVAQARVDWFSLTYDGYEGTLWNAQANLLYRLGRNVAVGIGYRLNGYEVRAERSNWRGEVDYRYHGPQVLVEVGF